MRPPSTVPRSHPEGWPTNGRRGPATTRCRRAPSPHASGHSDTSLLIAFAPRRANLVLNVLGATDTHDDLLAKLGPHQTGNGCRYLTNLDKNDLEVLPQLIEASFAAKVARAGDNATCPESAGRGPAAGVSTLDARARTIERAPRPTAAMSG